MKKLSQKYDQVTNSTKCRHSVQCRLNSTRHTRHRANYATFTTLWKRPESLPAGGTFD